jgi:hypothetical protein
MEELMPNRRVQTQASGEELPADAAGGETPAGGDGSSKEKAAAIRTREDFDKLPAGAWFINPKDKKPLQKKKKPTS